MVEKKLIYNTVNMLYINKHHQNYTSSKHTRRYITEILPIRRKTLTLPSLYMYGSNLQSINNQLINQF